jgi:hypothetical protein
VVLPIPKVSSPAKVSNDRPVSLLVGLSKVFEVLSVDGSANGETYSLQQLAYCFSIWISSAS